MRKRETKGMDFRSAKKIRRRTTRQQSTLLGAREVVEGGHGNGGVSNRTLELHLDVDETIVRVVRSTMPSD